MDRSQTMVHWKLFGFFFFLTLFAQIGAFTAIATADTFDGNVQFNLCWTVVALIYNVATLVACVDRPRLHGEERFPFSKPAGLHLKGRMFAGRLTDISITGASFACEHSALIKLGLRGEIWVNKVGRVPVEVKRRTDDGRLGVQFVGMDEKQRERLIGRLFSDANTNVAGRAEPAVAFSSLLRRSLIGEKRPAKPLHARRARQQRSLRARRSLPSLKKVNLRLADASGPRVSAPRGDLVGLLFSQLRAFLGMRL